MMNRITQLLGVLLLASVLLAGCSGEPEWVGVYEECKATVSDAMADANQGELNGEDAQAKALRESMNTMVLGMGMSACEMIKSACENDPDGATCQAYIEQKR